jgi:hypothetical protein
MKTFCPNCSSPCPIDAVGCAKCGATFGAGSAWRPLSLSVPPGKRPNVRSLPVLGAVWFALVGPLVPVLLVSLHYTPVIATFAKMYPLALVVGGWLAALTGFCYGLALAASLRYVSPRLWNRLPKSNLSAALAVSSLLTALLTTSRLGLDFAFHRSADFVSLFVLFIAPAFICAVPFTFRALKAHRAAGVRA